MGLALHYGVYRRLPQISHLSWGGALTTLHGTPRSSLLPWLLLGAFLLAMGFLAVANGYSDFDSIANWSLKGYAIAGTGDILAGARWGGHVLSYPMNLALSIAMFKLADGDLIPGSKLLYALLTVSLLLGCYRFLVRRNVSQTIAVVAALALLTTPVFFRNSISGLANLPFTTYLVLGILHSVEGISKLDVRQTLLGGLLLGFAAWTRPEGLLFGLAFLVLLYALAFLIGGTRPSRSLLLSSFLPMLIIPVTWMVLVGGAAISGDQIGQSLRQFTAAVLNGNLHPEAALAIVGFARASLLNTKTFGYIVGACALAILTTLPLTRWYRDPNRLIFSLLTILIFLLPALLFFVAYFREQDFNAFLQQSFDRAYLPALIMSILTAILALTYKPEVPATASDAQTRPTDVGSVR
jgi:hypothetical protein